MTTDTRVAYEYDHWDEDGSVVSTNVSGTLSHAVFWHTADAKYEDVGPIYRVEYKNGTEVQRTTCEY